MLQRLHRTDRLVDCVGGFLQRQAGNEPQEEDVALIIGEDCEERVDVIGHTGQGFVLDVAAVDVRGLGEIDRHNIRQATLIAMARAVAALTEVPDEALVDGDALPALEVPARAIVDGDARVAEISAASILAKVHRDALMVEMDLRYPGYGFAQHKGYPTPAHRAALGALGPCPEHRRSFAPVRACLAAAEGAR